MAKWGRLLIDLTEAHKRKRLQLCVRGGTLTYSHRITVSVRSRLAGEAEPDHGLRYAPRRGEVSHRASQRVLAVGHSYGSTATAVPSATVGLVVGR